MCLVIFAWLVAQDYFKMTVNDVQEIYEEQKNQIEQDMAPFGFLDDGLGEAFVDNDGDRWHVDEYGIVLTCGNIDNGLRRSVDLEHLYFLIEDVNLWTS